MPTETPPTLLIVDDSPANLDLLGELLRSEGYRVRAFPSGALALEAARRRAPDLFLVDVDMPEMDGFALCTRLKAEPTLAEVPLIFVSAHTDTSEKLRGFQAGAVDYVTKPFQLDELRARVETHLELRAQRRAAQNALARLREVEEARDALVHMMAHDMRSPLTVIFGCLDCLDSAPLDDEDATLVQDGLRAAHALRELVDTMLDVYRLESAQMPVSPVEVDLGAAVRAALADLAPLLASRALIVRCADGALPINADVSVLRRVIQNLVGNAIKYTDRTAGRIEVDVAPVGADRLRVTIADNGLGIAPEHHVRIFDKFFQVSARAAGGRGSTGLGLTFCKLAVEIHGGTIGVDSSPGAGSAFWFELPRA